MQAIKAWLKRQRAQGVEPNADQVWQRIKRMHPAASEDELERLFQSVV